MADEVKTAKKAATQERMTVTFEGLLKEFGSQEGEAKYFAIARLEGEFINPQTGEHSTGKYFFDPATEKGYRPELAVATLPADVRARVAEIIAAPQIKSEVKE